MVRFLLLRHGESENNGAKRYSGQYDTPLSEEGRAQAKKAAEYLKENYVIDAIYSSDLSRAMDTARPTAEAFGLEICPRKDLREIDVGIFQNRLFSEIRELYPEAVENYRYHNGRCIGGESYGDVAERAEKALAEIAARHDGQTVLIATHGGVVRSMLCLLDGFDIAEISRLPGIKNASLTVFEYDGDDRRVAARDVAHYLD